MVAQIFKMKKKGQLLVLGVVLFPTLFFLSMAISTNQVSIDEEKLSIEGAGGVEIKFEDISKMELIDELPEVTNAGSFSLGLIKKGNFQRVNDGEIVRVIRNDESPWIHMFTTNQEIYFNLSDTEQTKSVFTMLEDELAAKGK